MKKGLVVSLAVLALIGDAIAVRVAKEMVSTDDFKVLAQTKIGVKDSEETFKEQEEREGELKKASEEATHKEQFNEFDGTFHINGERFEPNGHKIGDVNFYSQIKSRKDEDDDSIAEGEARGSEVGAAGKEAVHNEKVRQDIDRNAAVKAFWDARVSNAASHPDGLVHGADGTLQEVSGSKVEGANAGIAYQQIWS